MMRINRFLALAGIASRRKADDLVRAGRVQVNGRVLAEVGVTVNPESDRITVDGRLVELPQQTQVVLFNKPAGYLVSRRAQGGKPTIYAVLPPNVQALHPIGRLDFDTDGVLLLTDDGELSRRLQHPRYEIERVYHAVVSRPPHRLRIEAARAGVDLGDKTPARAEIRILCEREHDCVLEVRLREGRKHEVKRLLGRAEAPVTKLTRVSFAALGVGRLAPGACRQLNDREIATLRRQVGLAESQSGTFGNGI